jgi:hypothetical protein
MVDWGKLLRCPPKQDTQCTTDLAACKVDLKAADDQLSIVQDEMNRVELTLAAALKERDELIKLSRLLTEGPEIPDRSKVRWTPQSYIHEVLAQQLGDKYNLCPAKHFSESDYLVTTAMEMKRFIDYYAMFWMPNIRYVTQQWKKLDGTQVEVWMNDCDDYADFFHGINALNANWACFPWGQVWADVQGFAMTGGHAFNIFICCDDNYNENSPVGLKAYLLEPQMAGGGGWPALGRQQVASYELRELKEVAGFFEINGAMWMVKL